MNLVLDIQGFKIEKNKFIVKELAGFNGEKICHYIFKPPFPFDMLSPDIQKDAKWVIEKYHSIQWDEGVTPLHRFNTILTDLVGKADRIYVKGKEKAEYIRRFTQKPILELEEQPRLQHGATKCFYHSKNISMCALSNVFFLYENFFMS